MDWSPDWPPFVEIRKTLPDGTVNEVTLWDYGPSPGRRRGASVSRTPRRAARLGWEWLFDPFFACGSLQSASSSIVTRTETFTSRARAWRDLINLLAIPGFPRRRSRPGPRPIIARIRLDPGRLGWSSAPWPGRLIIELQVRSRQASGSAGELPAYHRLWDGLFEIGEARLSRLGFCRRRPGWRRSAASWLKPGSDPFTNSLGVVGPRAFSAISPLGLGIEQVTHSQGSLEPFSSFIYFSCSNGKWATAFVLPGCVPQNSTPQTAGAFQSSSPPPHSRPGGAPLTRRP